VGPVTAIRPAIASGMRRRPSGTAAPALPAPTGGALVPVAPAARERPTGNGLHRPSAAFLAQLIAAERKLPQARERRRAEPHEAIAAYAAAALSRNG
jgi:hypothetical protein